MNKAVIGILVFIILLISAGYSRADDGVRIGIGRSVIKSEVSTGELGFGYNNWEFAVTQLGQGETKRGEQDVHEFYSVSYLTKPQSFKTNWAQPFLRLGVSYNDNKNPLVGDTNFRLGVGVDFVDVWRIEFGHFSSGGIHDPNSGVDWYSITYKMPFPFK